MQLISWSWNAGFALQGDVLVKARAKGMVVLLRPRRILSNAGWELGEREPLSFRVSELAVYSDAMPVQHCESMVVLTVESCAIVHD